MPKLALEKTPRPIRQAARFICPECKSPFWGTSGAWGHCNGRKPAGDGYSEACTFKWARELDWMHFRGRDGRKFLSLEDYERAVGPTVERGVS